MGEVLRLQNGDFGDHFLRADGELSPFAEDLASLLGIASALFDLPKLQDNGRDVPRGLDGLAVAL